VSRIVPLEPADALARAGAFLSRQLFAKARDRDGVQVWRPREDAVARMLRTFDWRAAFRMRVAGDVVVRAIPCPDGTLVRIDATTRDAARLAPRIVAGALVAGGAAATVVAASVLDPAVVVALAGGGGTAVAGGGGYVSARAALRRGERKVLDALEGMLDDLERADGALRISERALARVRAVYRA
jgi:hypothetical protein